MQETLSFKTKLRLINLTFRTEFKRGYPEKFANQEFYPTKNYHKEWYDVDTDSVMICPLGTKGKIINLDGLEYHAAKTQRKDILLKYPKGSNIGEDKKCQRFNS
jgi:hypothetical protein